MFYGEPKGKKILQDSTRFFFDYNQIHTIEEGLDGGISKTLNTKILPSITSNIKILGCLTSNTKKFSETLKLIQM